MSEGASNESLQAAAAAIKQAVATHGTTHPVVLEKLENYIALLHAAGNTAEAQKLEEKAKLVRQALEATAPTHLAATSPAPPVQAVSSPAAPFQTASSSSPQGQAMGQAPATPAAAQPSAAISSVSPVSAVSAPTAPQQTELKSWSEPNPGASTYDLDSSEAAPVEYGRAVYDLDSEASQPVSGQAARNAVETATSAVAERHLFNSKGEHIATASDGALYTAEGRNLGRWVEDLGVFLDRSGWYLGQVVDDDRLARDHNWQFKHINFGDRGNEGNRSGWGRQADTAPTTLPRDFDDVKFSEEEE